MPLPLLAHALRPYLGDDKHESSSVAAGMGGGVLGGMLGRKF
jgi:hypothetical protein